MPRSTSATRIVEAASDGARIARRLFAAVVFALVVGASVPGSGAAAPGSEAPELTQSLCWSDRVLRLSDPPPEGHDVWELQARLAELGYYDGPVDSRFSPLLEEALRSFQRERGLPADGVAGPQTWEALAGEADIHYWPVAAMPPPPGEVRIVVDSEKLTLTVYSDDVPYKTYPVAVGRPSFYTLTPVGQWKVVHKSLNWGGGFGTRWIGLNVPWGIYGIHGTNKPYSIGRRASAGCIRMFNRDVEELYTWVKIGTPVEIVGVKPQLTIRGPLTPGTSGREIVELQLRLADFGFSTGGADGRYGPMTEEAVRRLQRLFGLPETGRAELDVLFLLGML